MSKNVMISMRNDSHLGEVLVIRNEDDTYRLKTVDAWGVPHTALQAGSYSEMLLCLSQLMMPHLDAIFEQGA